MINVKLKYIALFFGLIFLLNFHSFNLFAQNKKDLEKQRKTALNEIKLSNNLLKENQQKRKINLNQLQLIKRKISNREKIINSYNTEIRIVTNDISNRKQEISNLKSEIIEIKDEYANLILSAYYNKHQSDKWMFILSSSDFNQAYRRIKYLQQFSDYRKRQVKLIEEKEAELNTEISELQKTKTQRISLIESEIREKANLSKEKKNIASLISSLKSNEKALKAEIKKNEKSAKQIKRIIDKILAEEKRKREAALNKKSNTKFALTPEEALISSNFGKNKGKFPWPTERGVITSSFGKHAHPVLKGITINNNGIDISTERGSAVRTIFDGEVRDVWAIQGKNMAVIIKHGGYFSVYQNLKDVTVKPGDMVKSKETIGTVYTDTSDGNKTVLHIEIWKGSKSQNPKIWLARK